jgi:hypothetical protein
VRNCIVLGSARSGTSALAGTLFVSGYGLGSQFDRATESNPKGYFEDLATRHLNNRLLQPLAATTHTGGQKLFARPLDSDWESWLAIRPAGYTFPSTSVSADEMKSVLTPAPFARKDPRFCLTLDAWRPVLADSAFVCIFRSPSITARSILKHIHSVETWRDVGLDFDGALKLWGQSYREVVERHARSGDWFFLHYDQLLDGSALKPLGEHLNVRIKPDFIDSALNRSTDTSEIPTAIASIYEELCDRAKYRPFREPLSSTRVHPPTSHSI